MAQQAQQWNWLDIPMRPALPPPPSTADVYEPAGGESYVIEMHVPGLTPEEIVVEATADGLRVSTHPHQEENSDRMYLQREQENRAWSRLFDFPMEIDPDKVQAKLEAGILRINAPKALSSPTHIIQIKEQSGQAAHAT